MPEIQLAGIGMAVASSIVYSLAFYIKKRPKDVDEFFQPKKMIATLIVGVAVGVSLELSGAGLSEESLQTQLAAYAGTVALVESAIKTVYRQLRSSRK